MRISSDLYGDLDLLLLHGEEGRQREVELDVPVWFEWKIEWCFAVGVEEYNADSEKCRASGVRRGASAAYLEVKMVCQCTA
jgi:hypothetical protein